MLSVAEQLNPTDQEHIVLDPQFDGIGTSTPSEIVGLNKSYNKLSMGLHLMFIKEAAVIGHDEQTGIGYAAFRHPGDSEESMIVLGNPFTVDLDDNLLLRSDYAYKALKALGVRDSQGKTLPLLSLAKPGPNSTMRFAPDKKSHKSILKNEISQGNFEPAGELHLDVVRRLYPKVGKIGRVAFSLDACIAPTEAILASSMSLDMTHLVLGDPVNVLNRSRRELFMKDFAPEGKQMKPAVARAGIKPFIELHDGDSDWGFVKNVASEPRLNYSFGSGMTHNTFAEDLVLAANSGTIVTVGVTNKGTVSPVDATLGAVVDARAETGEKIYSVEFGDRGDETHCIGDQMGVMAVFNAYGLTHVR